MSLVDIRTYVLAGLWTAQHCGLAFYLCVCKDRAYKRGCKHLGLAPHGHRVYSHVLL